jgi:hypothetical protein
MKLVKSLLLGSAAGIAAVAGAQAADLPSRKAAPVEYVRVCSAYGAGFFYIPGTDTCLRVGGRIRAEYLVQERFNPPGLDVQDQYGFRARGRLNIDARTATSYGTLRTFIRYEMTVSNGSYGQGVNSTGPNFAAGRGGQGTVSSNLEKGFIQFGPITAGRAQSFFDFYADALNYGPIRGSDLSANLLAYTATFGSGFSATLSLEDRSEREAFITGQYPIGGSDYPDVIASLNVTQGWGSAQLSGAIFQRNVASPVGVLGLKGDDVGFALQGGVKINLPMLAAGDELWLQAAYAEGGISYLGYGGNSPGSTWGKDSRVGLIDFANADAVVDVNGRLHLTKGFAITAGLLHYWTPTIRQAVYGSYSELDYARQVGNWDPKEFRVGTNLIWSPVAGLDIGVEVLYARVELKNRIGRPDGRPGLIKSDDALSGRLRIQRDF